MRLPIYFILTTAVIDAMGIGLVMPVMPSLLREIGDIPLASAALWGGVLTTIFAVMQFLFGPIVGAISDRYGRRPVLLISLGVMALDYLVMAVAQTFWLLFLGRLIGGITAATQATNAAAMADISSDDEKTARFGLLSAAFGIGFVLGPVIGGVLADFGTRAPFYAAAALAAANMVFGYFVMPETVTDKTRRALSWKRANPLGAFAQVSLNPMLRRLLIVFFVYQVAFFVYPSVWAYYTTARFGWSPSMTGVSLGAFGISIALVQGVLIRVALKHLKERGTLLAGLIYNCIAFLVLAFVTNGTLALLFTPITALGAIATPALQGIMSKATPDDSQGELQGVLASTSALATIISPLMMTSVFAYFAAEDAPIYLPGAPFLLSLALMGLCLAIYLAPSGPSAAAKA